MEILSNSPENYDAKSYIEDKLKVFKEYIFTLNENLMESGNDDAGIIRTQYQVGSLIEREQRYSKLQDPSEIAGYFYVPANTSRQDIKNLLHRIPEYFIQEIALFSDIADSLVSKIESSNEKAQHSDIVIPLSKSEKWLVDRLLDPNDTLLAEISGHLNQHQGLIDEIKNIHENKLSMEEKALINDLKSFFHGGFLQSFASQPNSPVSETDFKKHFEQGLTEIFNKNNIHDISDLTTKSPTQPMSPFGKIKRILCQLFERFFPSLRLQEISPLEAGPSDKFKILKDTYESIKLSDSDKENTPENSPNSFKPE